MIERIAKVYLTKQQFNYFEFLANIDNQDMYVCDVNTAKGYFKEFLDKADLQEINQNNVKYVMFTKEM